MKRLGALLGFTSFAVLSFAFFLGESVALWSIAPLATLLVVFCIFKRLRKFTSFIVALICALVSLGGYLLYTEYNYNAIVNNYSETSSKLVITATVCEKPYINYDKHCYMLKTQTINGNSESIKILLRTTDDIKANVSDIVTFRCKLSVFKYNEYKTKGCYLYYNSQDEFYGTVTKADSRSIVYYTNKIRDALEEPINNYMNSDTAGVCNAMCFGDKYAVTTEVKENFRNAGISHTLVVSGLHLSIIAMVMLFILSKILRHRQFYCPLCILFVLFYMIMTGLSYSVVRSGIMVIIMLVSILIKRDTDSLNSLGIALIVLLIINPYSAGDTGLILSASSTLGIILFSSSMEKYICRRLNFKNRIIRGLIGVFSVTLSASIAVLPCNIFIFNSVPLLSIVTNLLVVPVVTLLIIVTAVGAVLGLTGVIGIYSPFLFASNYLAGYMIRVAKAVADFPYSTVKTDEPFVYIWLFMTLALVGIIILIKNYKKTVPIVVTMSALILMCGFVSSYVSNYNKTILKVYDTGKGITATVTDRNNTVILSCGGDNYHDIAQNLDNASGEYSLLSITNENNSRENYASDIIQGFDLKNILIYDSIIKVKTKSKVVNFTEDCSVTVGRMNIQYIVRDYSVFTYLQCDGKSILVLPPYANCELLDKKYRNPDVVILDTKVTEGSLINTDLVIMCCTEYSYAKQLLKTEINSKKIYTTFNGDFVSEMKVW